MVREIAVFRKTYFLPLYFTGNSTLIFIAAAEKDKNTTKNGEKIV